MNILKSEHVNRRLILIGAISVAALTAAAAWLPFSLFHPTPPVRYQYPLTRRALRLVPSTGAVESMTRLRNPTSGISIAIIPGGIGNHKEPPGPVSLGTLFYEPLWLFSRGQHLENLEQLRNLRISIGWTTEPAACGCQRPQVETL
jgi:hypothetical protein